MGPLSQSILRLILPTGTGSKPLILDSGFSSYRSIAREKIAESVIGWPFQYPLSILINDDFSPVDCISKVAPIPVLIMHGQQDEIVPEHHSRILYEAALQPKELWELAIQGHVKSGTEETTRKRLLGYLARLKRETSLKFPFFASFLTFSRDFHKKFQCKARRLSLLPDKRMLQYFCAYLQQRPIFKSRVCK